MPPGLAIVAGLPLLCVLVQLKRILPRIRPGKMRKAQSINSNIENAPPRPGRRTGQKCGPYRAVKRFVVRWGTFAFVTAHVLTPKDVRRGEMYPSRRISWWRLAIQWRDTFRETTRPVSLAQKYRKLGPRDPRLTAGIRPETLAENYRNARNDCRIQQLWSDMWAANEAFFAHHPLAQGIRKIEALCGRLCTWEDLDELKALCNKEGWYELGDSRLEITCKKEGLSEQETRDKIRYYAEWRVWLARWEALVGQLRLGYEPLFLHPDDLVRALKIQSLAHWFREACRDFPAIRRRFRASLLKEVPEIAKVYGSTGSARLAVEWGMPWLSDSWLARNRREIEAGLREVAESPPALSYGRPITDYAAPRRTLHGGTAPRKRKQPSNKADESVAVARGKSKPVARCTQRTRQGTQRRRPAQEPPEDPAASTQYTSR